MKINRNWIYPVAGAIVAGLLIVSVIWLCNRESADPPTVTEPSDEQTTETNPATEPTPESTEKPQEPTEPTEPSEPQRNPIHLVDFDEGNEVYLDMDVIAILTEMEAEGEEDLVNAILLGEIQTINYFAKRNYTHRAICQAQRFYFDFYDAVKEMEFDAFAEKLSACIPAEGADLDGFAQKVQNAFGWGEGMDFSYVTEVEVSA
ncbi:MAG: hypothetical protein IKC59_03035 [Clostridia bacterium]|nr:hypothetical protein [Clostridia bacterium]